MTVPSLLEEPGRVDEPQAAQEYAAVLTQVVAAGRPVIVRRNGRGPGGRRHTGAPGAGPGIPGAPRSGEIGCGDRLDPGARDPPPTAIVVRRQGRQPLRAGGGTSVVSGNPVSVHLFG